MAAYKSSGVTVTEADGAPSVSASTVKFSNSTVTDNGDGSVSIDNDGATDHGALTGLSDDDHAQYALLAGRSGGQTIDGDTASGGNLTLASTAHATKGKILLGASGPSVYDETNDRLGLGITSPTTRLHVKRTDSTGTVAFFESTSSAVAAQIGVNSDGCSLRTISYGTAYAEGFGGTSDKADSVALRGFNNSGGMAIVSGDATSTASMRFHTGGEAAANVRLTIDVNGNIVPNTAALATNATNGFVYLGTCAGTPTGVPAGSYTGRVPIVYDSTNSKLYAYANSAWSLVGTGATPAAHATSHQNGGSDEIATATAGSNAIPKAGAGGTLAIGWIPTGSTSSTVCIGNDSRLSDSRTPTTHATSHKSGGSDEIASATPGAGVIPKAGAGGNLAVGFLATGTPTGSKFVRDDGTLAVPSGIGAPTDATYITLTTNGTLSDERTLAVDSSLSKTDAGAGSTVTLSRAALTGDVTASAGSNATTIATAAVTPAKMADLAGLSLLGRSANTSGVTAAITGTDGQVARVSGTTLGFGTVATAGIATNAVDNTILRDSGALSVIGRSANSSGDPADISTSADGDVLRRSGTTLGFGTIAEGSLALTDVTTNNASTSNHGFLKKLDNNSAHFMDGTGAWSTPASGQPAGYTGSLVTAADKSLAIGASSSYNEFTSASGNLAFLPTTGFSAGRVVIIRNATNSNQTIEHNASSPPTGYAAIFTPTAANYTFYNRHVYVFAFNGTTWAVGAYAA